VQTCDLFSAAATTMDSSNSVSIEEQKKLRELTSVEGTSQLSNFQPKKCTHPANIEHYLFAVVAEHARNQHRQILQVASAAEIWQMSEMAAINVNINPNPN
jgi:hypothetical protein